MKYLLYCLLILPAFAPSAAAQVMIAPTMIYMDVREPFETFTVINQSDAPQEVSLEFEFGYPTSDEAGNRVFEFDDSIAAESYSLNEWVRAFPRQFILEPGKRQVVRLMVRAPSTLPEGVYWTRLATRSMGHISVDNGGAGLVQAKVNLALRQIIPVLFRSGNPSHTVILKDLRADIEDGHVRISAHLERQGEAPFLGTATLEIFDDRGQVVQTVEKQSEVYFTYTQRMGINRDELLPGRYTAQLTLEPRLSGVPSHRLPEMKPVSDQIAFDVSAN